MAEDDLLDRAEIAMMKRRQLGGPGGDEELMAIFMRLADLVPELVAEVRRQRSLVLRIRYHVRHLANEALHGAEKGGS